MINRQNGRSAKSFLQRVLIKRLPCNIKAKSNKWPLKIINICFTKSHKTHLFTSTRNHIQNNIFKNRVLINRYIRGYIIISSQIEKTSKQIISSTDQKNKINLHHYHEFINFNNYKYIYTYIKLSKSYTFNKFGIFYATVDIF